jgi:hypothetical protein
MTKSTDILPSATHSTSFSCPVDEDLCSPACPSMKRKQPHPKSPTSRLWLALRSWKQFSGPLFSGKSGSLGGPMRCHWNDWKSPVAYSCWCEQRFFPSQKFYPIHHVSVLNSLWTSSAHQHWNIWFHHSEDVIA